MEALNTLFQRFAHKISDWSGKPLTFIASLVLLGAWALLGPKYEYSDTWQLIINTSTTIITFLMVFLIQNTQNRDARAIHLKLDELIRATSKARNTMIDLENLSDRELDAMHEDLCRQREEADRRLAKIRDLKK